MHVTGRRTKVDFVNFVSRPLRGVYSEARKVHLVSDNLNTHFRSSFDEVLGLEAAAVLLRRVEFSSHAQTRQLAQHGRNRDRHPERQCLGKKTSQGPGDLHERCCRLAAAP